MLGFVQITHRATLPLQAPMTPHGVPTGAPPAVAVAGTALVLVSVAVAVALVVLTDAGSRSIAPLLQRVDVGVDVVDAAEYDVGAAEEYAEPYREPSVPDRGT